MTATLATCNLHDLSPREAEVVGSERFRVGVPLQQRLPIQQGSGLGLIALGLIVSMVAAGLGLSRGSQRELDLHILRRQPRELQPQ